MPTFSKNARHVSSITNKANCGGNKKAGLGTTIGARSFMINRTRQNNIYNNSLLEELWKLVGNNPNVLVGENNGDFAGISLAISADASTVAIGESGFDGNKGRVRVFRLNGGNWKLVGNADDLEGEKNDDQAGRSVALSSDGNTVAIGEPGFDGRGFFGKGRVRVFRLNGGNWNLVGNNANDLEGKNDSDRAGGSVALSADGNTVAIGDGGFDDDGNNKGRVRVFRLNGGNWNLVGNNANDLVGENNGDGVGSSVALSTDGNTVALGEIGFGFDPGFFFGKGRVRVFRLDGGNWKLVGNNPNVLEGENDSDITGNSVALSSDGNTVAIGEPGFDGNGRDKGRVRVFRLDGGNWKLVGNANDLVGENNDNFAGAKVALSADGNTVAFGEPGFDGDGNNKGRVRVFRLNGANQWTLVGNNPNVLEGENDNNAAGFVALSADGNKVAFGETGFDGGKGRVRVFALTSSGQLTSPSECPPAFSNYKPVLSGVGNMYRFISCNNFISCKK